MPARRSSITVAVFCVLAALLAACTQQSAGTPSAAAPTPDAALARFYAQKISWGPCASFAPTAADRVRYSRPTFDCGTFEAPLDYAAPTGRTVSVAVLRQKATGARIGSLLVNPGGPGASGNRTVTALGPAIAERPIGQRFDIVGFDPRGVGASKPTLDCLTDADWAVERADLDVDPSPAGVAQTERENQDYARKCAERSGGAEVLANVGTRDVVKDLDILREVLGDAKLTYLGYSYGTRIGSTYAETFPDKVRALVLDGALDPTETTVDRTVKQNAGFQQAFEAYAADCATQPSCPLGTDPAQATARFQALSRPLIDAPLAVGDRVLSYSDATTAVVLALYDQGSWPVLSQAISEMAAGRGERMLRLADAYYDRAADGHYSNFIEAFTAISCVDEERITDRAQEADLIRRAVAAAPFRDDGRGVVAALEQCAFWPAPVTAQPHVPRVEGLPPTMVISTTGDPATPYQAGVDLAKGLNGSLVTFEGTQHTVALSGNSCVDDAVTRYLVDLQLPATDPKCAA